MEKNKICKYLKNISTKKQIIAVPSCTVNSSVVQCTLFNDKFQKIQGKFCEIYENTLNEMEKSKDIEQILYEETRKTEERKDEILIKPEKKIKRRKKNEN